MVGSVKTVQTRDRLIPDKLASLTSFPRYFPQDITGKTGEKNGER